MISNLSELIKERSNLTNKGITFIESSENEDFLSYNELYLNALNALSLLQNHGIKPQDELVFQIDNNKTFVIIFWACILGGIIPIPLTVGRNDDHRQKLFNVWGILNNPFLIISLENLQRIKKHIDIYDGQDFDISILNNYINEQDIYCSKKSGVIHQPDENDIAYIQFSSGSTGNPKGVTLTHKNLITNMKGISEASLYNENDSKLSWMPLTHDMGLIGFHLCPLFCGMNQFLMPTNLFIRRPALWLDKATQHKATILCSPNFGFRYLLKQYNPENEYQWDLSNVRMVYNGAEPISEEICNEFHNALESYKLSKTAIYPVYGLAEASLAVSFSNLTEEVVSLKIDRNKTHVGETVAVRKKNENTVSFVNVGSSIPYCSLQIVDDNNKVCNEDIIGHILIKGDNVTSGYYNNSEATKTVINGKGWLDTGDLGFTHKGCLYVTGRSKDIIFINGQNYYPHDIERSLETIDNIELGKVVTAGYTNKVSGEEEIFVYVLHKEKTDKFIEIYNKIKKHINQTFGFEPNCIIPVREIPKTTSGKIQRFKLIEEYTSGTFYEVIQEIQNLAVIQQSDTKYSEAANETEQKLAEIWSVVLSHNNFGVTHKFFEIGGNSLNGAQVISAIHKEFGIELDYSILFEKQSIRKIATEISTYELINYEGIPKIREQDYYPLSSAQKRLYYLWEVDKESIAYNIPVAFMISGNLDIERLENAIILLIERHEILRASFFMLGVEPALKINKKLNFNLAVSNIELKNAKVELKNRVIHFDLNNSPLFRIELLRISNERHILFLDFHHIISDGVSISIFIDELFKAYKEKKLPELDIQYKDYIKWENINIESEKIKKQEDYWLHQFQDDVPVLNLPIDLSRPSLMAYYGAKLNFKIDKTLTTNLRKLAKQESTTLFTLLLTAYHILLSKYTGQEDIITGVPIAGRNHPELQPVFGMFVNNLAIRSYPKGDLTFKEFLNQLQYITLQSINNKDYPFGNLAEQIGQKRDVSRNTLFDTMFNYQNMEISQFKVENFFVEQFFFDPGFSKYDISLEVFDQDEEIKYYIEYSTALFQQDTINRFANHFESLLNAIVESPNNKLSDLSIIGARELDKLIQGFNDTESFYPKDKVVHQLFEGQALEYPDEIAVIRGNLRDETEYSSSCITQLTYKELNERANQLANFLRKKDVAPNIPVAIVMDRSPELIIGILAILKAGGCYLPIDIGTPDKRINFILSNSQVKIVFTDYRIAGVSLTNDQLSNDYNIQYINIVDQSVYTKEETTIKNINFPHNLAYIIYTSGTTGNPKGVMVEHQSLINYVSFANKTYIKGGKVSFPLYTSISFDLTVTSIFTPLISGNTIVTYPDNEKSLPLEDIITDNQIHILKATPSHLKMLKEYPTLKEFDYFSNIKRLIVGGEALTMQLAEDIHDVFDGDVEIYNEYGPTEATVGCMIYKYYVEKDKNQTVPIGIPADNTQIYLLDNYLKPVPIGVTGEIYISGDCLARGYLFNSELTEDKFIGNPYTTNQKMYKTGDLAKWLPDGNIEFIGRVDQQVKVNGYRVEIEEIEQQIVKCEGVNEAIVLYKDGELIAYVVTEVSREGMQKTDNLDCKTIKAHLAVHLPNYMTPKYIVPIDSVPITKNGKIDYSLLPPPNQITTVEEEAKNDIQKVMVSVWQDVLYVNRLGISDNFFELGGDSIKAVQIASRLFDNNISVNVKDILTYQTIEQLCLHAKITDGSTQYEQGIVVGDVELNPIQHWFFKQNFENPHFYNQSILLKFIKPINKEILEETFEILIQHHDGLRLNYCTQKEFLYYNNNHLKNTFDFKEYYAEEDEIQSICHQIGASFNIEDSLLIKAVIIKSGNSNLLFITAHHFVIDGISWRILLEDFYNIYKSLANSQKVTLPYKTASLIDFNNKAYENLKRENLQNQKSFWRNIENEISKSMDSTSTYNQQKAKVKNIKKVVFELSEDKTRFILSSANKLYNSNIEIVILSVFINSIKSWRKCTDLIVEIERHGRSINEIELNRTIGWFTSLFPVFLSVNNCSLIEQIKHIKEKLNDIQNDGISYGILKYLDQSLSDIQVFPDLRFNYLGQFDSELNNDLFEIHTDISGLNEDINNHITTNLEVNSFIINRKLQFEIKYNEFNNDESSIDSLVELIKSDIDVVFEEVNLNKTTKFTPSDFETLELDETELKLLFND